MPAPKLMTSAMVETVSLAELHDGWEKAERLVFEDLIADTIRKTAKKKPRFAILARSYIYPSRSRSTESAVNRDRLPEDALTLCAGIVRRYVLECELPRGVNDTRPTSPMVRDFIDRAIDKLFTLFLRARVYRDVDRHRQTVGQPDRRYRMEARHVPVTDEALADLAALRAADSLDTLIDALRYRQLFPRVARLAEAGDLVDPETGRKMRADRLRTIAELARFLSGISAEKLDRYFPDEDKLKIAPLHRDLAAAGLSYDAKTVDRIWRDVTAAAIQLETRDRSGNR